LLTHTVSDVTEKWCLPYRTTGSSSNNNNSQYSNKDDSDDDGEEMIVFFYGENSGNECGTDAPTTDKTTDTTNANGSNTDLLGTILTDNDDNNDYNTYNDSGDSFCVHHSNPDKFYNEISDDDYSGMIFSSSTSSSSFELAKLLCDSEDGGVGVAASFDEDECEMESDCDSFGDSNRDDNSGDDGAYQTDLGIGSGLVTKYIYSKFSSEEDYESFEYNDSSQEFAEVFGKFMDQYKTQFDDDGKLLQGFALFDPVLVPYDDLLQALRSTNSSGKLGC
jgi:hypothetical protein